MATKLLADIVTAKESVEEKLLKQPGVTGVDVGYKYVDGKPTDEIAIRVMVAKKKKTVPEKEKVPDTIDGVKTDVIERTYFLHEAKNKKPVEEIDLQSDTGSYNPVKGGISIGPCRVVGGSVYAGTLGAIVRDNATSTPMLLSNFHVMCVDTGWHAGDTMAQPSRVDGGSCPASVVGTLQRAQLTASVDAAVCSLSGRGFSCEIVDIGMVAGTNTATLGMAVRKRGRTTGLTYGIVDSISLTINIDYGDGIGNKTLTNQIGIRPDTAHNAAFGDHGDSGSAVVDNDRKIVGLHFAGSSDGHGVSNQIAAVLSALNVTVCTSMAKTVLKDLIDHKHGHKELEKVHKDKNEKLEIKEIEKIVFEGKVPFEGKGPVEKFNEGGKLAEVGQPGSPVLPGGAQAGSQQPGKIVEKSFDKQFDKIPLDKQPKELKVELKDGKNESKDFKIEWKEHKNESKEHKIEWKEHVKDIKELKIEAKEHGKTEFEKPIRDNVKDFSSEVGPKFGEGGDPFNPGSPFNPGIGAQGSASPAKVIEGKPPDKQPVDKPVKSDKEKVEIKENKPESKEVKNEFKEHKNEAKELKNEAKEHKNEHKEHIKDFKEKNDAKEHKNESKEFKIEFKEHTKPEFEKQFRENPKDLVEGGGKFAEGGDPFQPNLPGGGGVQGASAQANVGLKTHVDKFKDFKEFKEIEKTFGKAEGKDKNEFKDQKPEAKDKNEAKEHKIEWKEHTKDKFEKEHKIELKEHTKTEFEKIIPENPKLLVENIPKFAEGGDPFRPNLPAGGGAQGASAQANVGLKTHVDKFKDFKEIEKIKPEKEHLEKIKPEKEHLEKIKPEKEHLEKIKPEKEHVEKFKPEKEFSKDLHLDKNKVEFEKIVPENPKSLVEGGGKFAEGGDPFQPNLPGGAPIESRMSQLEAAVAQLSTFITQSMRPDLGSGALTNEPDQKPKKPGGSGG